MRKLLLASLTLLAPGAAYAQCRAPAPATAAGYTTQTLGGSPANWLPSSPSGTGTTKNADGSVTIASPTNNGWNGQLQTYANGQGSAFGGGGYFQATLSWSGNYSGSDGWPSFWADSTEGATDRSHWTEADFMEAWANDHYSGTLHNWLNNGAINQQTSSGGIYLPSGSSPATPHTYGFLWVPATAATQGYAKWFLDGQQQGSTVTWNQGDQAYGYLDQQHLTLFLGTGSNAMTVSNVQVWQNPATANDIGVSASSASVDPGCAAPMAISTSEFAPVPNYNNPTAAEIVPGQGSIVDPIGQSWAISSDSCIQKDGQNVPGGCASAAIQVVNGVVWGKDDGTGPVCAGCWFTLGSDGWEQKPGQSPPTDIQTATLPPTGPIQSCPANGPATGTFHIAGGQIIGPDGKTWTARGLNLYDDQLDQAEAMTASFPGLDFVRVNIHSYQDPSAYQSFVAQMTTAAGRVVEFEDHPDGGGGQDAGPPKGMAAELSWYANMAKAFAGNPYVWFGTFNEPMATPGLSAWQRATYDAIRGAGNNNPILLEISGYPGNWTNSLDPSVYATMTNTIWDPHFYGWVPRYSTDQATVDRALADELGGIQQIKSADGTMPVFVGEFGNSTNGTIEDTNGIQAVTSVINGVTQKNIPGAAAWAYNPGGNSDHVTQDGQITHPYGDMIRLFIGNNVVPMTDCQVKAWARQTADAATVAALKQGN